MICGCSDRHECGECEGSARMAGWKYYNRETHLKEKEQTLVVEVRWKAAASRMSLPNTRTRLTIHSNPKIALHSKAYPQQTGLNAG